MAQQPGRVDAARAALFCAASQLFEDPPALDYRMAGPSVPGGWRSVPGMASDMGSWVTFAGDDRGPLIPSRTHYRMAGIIAMRYLEIRDLQRAYPQSRHAIAQRFGEAIVVGVLNERLHFGSLPADRDTVLGACRIGRKSVTTIGGIWTNKEEFIPVATTKYAEDPYHILDVPGLIPIA